MDLAALQTHLNQSVSNGLLTIAATDSALPPEFQTYLKTVPNQQITLKPTTGTGIALAGPVLTVTGTSADSWPVQGMTGVAVTLSAATVTITDASPPTFAVAASGTIQLSPSVRAAVNVASAAKDTDPWVVTLASDAQGVTPTQLIQLGTVGALALDIPTQLDVVDQTLAVVKDKFRIEFYPETTFNYRYAFTVTAPAAKWEPVKGILALNGLDFSAFQTQSSASAQVVGHLVIDKFPVDLGIGISSGDSCIAFVKPTSGGTFPGVMALAGWAFGSDLAGSANAGFGSVGFTPSDFDLAISRVEVEFNWRCGGMTSLRIASVLTIKGLVLDVSAQLPGLVITGALKDNKPLAIKDLINSFGLDAGPVPASLTLKTLSLTARLAASSYRFAISVDNVWSIGPLDIKEIQLAISYVGGAAGIGFQGHFDCTLDIAQITLELSVDYLGAGTGWTFSGATQGDTPIKIGDLLADLTAKFKVTAPAPVQSLALHDIGVSYETATGKFTFALEADLTVESEAVAITVAANVTSKAGTQEYEYKFTGTILVANLLFTLTFDEQDKTSKTFIASYSKKDGDPTHIPLKSLISDISPKLGQAIPGDLDIELKDVKLVFVGETKGSSFAFGLDLGLSIGLSDLPVVGHMLPADTALSIENLQAIYASAAMTTDQVGKINGLLPQGVAALPSAGLSAGMNLSGDLKLGSWTQHVALGVPAQSSSNTNGQSTNTSLAVAAVSPSATPTTSSGQGNTKWITIGKSAGPISIGRIGLQYQNSKLFFLLDASLNFSALQLGLDGLGFGSPLTSFKPEFHLDGISVSFSAGPVKIEGGLLVVRDLPTGVTEEYMGAITIAIEPYLISGVASYAKVDGATSFFAFAQIEGEFGGPPAFFITGFMGGFGYNSQLTLPEPNEVYKFPFVAGLDDKSIFGSANPTPLQVMNTLSGSGGSKTAWVTPVKGEDWIAGGIMFRSFELVLGHALLVVTFGKEFEIALLGLASMSLPQGSSTDAYAFVELQLEIVFKPDDGSFIISASLTPNSFVLTRDCHLTGGFAFAIWFGSNPHAGDFVVTIGGYHPAFTPPGWYPNVPQVGFNWPVGGGVTVKGGAYFALTPTAVMAGGGLEVLFESGDLRAWFTAYANIMIRWKPFHFTASIGISIGASYRLNLLFTHVTITIELGASLDMWGPPTGGIVHIHWYIISFSVGFGADEPDAKDLVVDWTGFKALLPAKTPPAKNRSTLSAAAVGAADTSAILKVQANGGLVRQSKSDGTWTVRADAFAFTTQSAIPATVLQINGAAVASPAGAPGKINIRPMGLSAVDSTHNVTIYCIDEKKNVDLSAWTRTTQTASLPKAMWGEPLTGKDSPAPTAETIPNLPTGFRLAAPSAKAGAQVGPLDPTKLVTELGGGYLPLIPATPDPIQAPKSDSGSIGTIATTLASPASQQTQKDIVAALARLDAAPPTSAPLIQLSQRAGRVFTQPPLLVA